MNTTEIRRFIYLEEMDKLLESHYLQKLNHEKIENPNRLINM